jgi:2-oxo-4-hydroxy-4-carboxy-5-ureidoimidazoline decarboxylase
VDDVDLDRINSWGRDEARAAFLKCCGSHRWAEGMVAKRPFADEAELFDAAERAWWGLDRTDWLEAFAAHPQIGDLDALREKFAATADWSAGEQAGVAGAPEEILAELARGNLAYRTRFGYIFIVCATGKTAGEMLDLLRGRLDNTPEEEIAIAAAEQAKITRIRLGKLGS